MNQYIPYREIHYKPRRIVPLVRSIAATLPVVVITGARQVGKSTMLRQEFADYDYLTCDDYALLEQARRDPHSLWLDREKIIIDEAQRVPELFHAIKLAVDRSDRRKRFIISGSANLYLMAKVTESLAGRATYVDLLPLTYGEMAGIGAPTNFARLWQAEFAHQPLDRLSVASPVAPIDALDVLLTGCMPPVMALESHDQALIWLDGYVRTYLERDLRELSQVESLIDVRKVMQCLALRTGNILNQADVAKDCALSHVTTHRYIKLLEVSHIINRVPAYYKSLSKRIVKSPKLFVMDPGLAVFLSGYTDKEALADSRELGGYFETLVYLHLKSLCQLMTPRAEIYYWRTSTRREVDFVIEHGRRLLPVEVKWTSRPITADAESLLAFLDEHPQAPHGVLVHRGHQIQRLHSRVIAVPWWWLDR